MVDISGNFCNVVINYSNALLNYNKITYPDKSEKFYYDMHHATFNGIRFHNGLISVRKIPWWPFSYITVYNGANNWIDGINYCVVVAIERQLIEQTTHLKSMYNEQLAKQSYKRKVLADHELKIVRKLKWLCK